MSTKIVKLELTPKQYRQLVVSLKNDYVDNDDSGCKVIQKILEKLGEWE